MIKKCKGILITLTICSMVSLTACNKAVNNNITQTSNPQSNNENISSSVPTKEEILNQIDLGISVIEESIENFTKQNPGKKPEEKLNNRGESSLKQVQLLKQLKDDLKSNKISQKDAWSKVLEIRDGKSA